MFEQCMFADSLLETSWAHRSRRSLTALTSFGLQAIVVGLLMMIPILTTVGLPAARVLPTPVSWGAPPPPAPVHHERVTTLNQSNFVDHVLITPPSIPPRITQIDETTAPPQVSYNNVPGVEGGTGAGSDIGVWGALNDSAGRVTPTLAPPPSIPKHTFRTSSMLQGSLIRRVDPVYPPMARAARIQGPVLLAAVISKDGIIENLRTLSGHPMLVPAAISAVSQWRYKPYILNGEAIEVDTQITVNFVLGVN